MKAAKWKDLSEDPLNVETIRRLFQPSADYRISEYEYPSGTEFPGLMRGGTCFVLRGACRYDFECDTVTLEVGDICDLPSGAYTMKVVGDDGVAIVHVWDLAKLAT